MRTYKEIAQRLEASRYSQGLTQRDLAKKLHLSQPVVGRYVSKEDMNVSTLIRWAEALGLEIVLVPASVADRAQGVPERQPSPRAIELVDRIWAAHYVKAMTTGDAVARLMHTISVTEAGARELLANRGRPSARYARQEI